jgi:hypothetical protein
MQLELAAEEAELTTRRAAQAIAEQEQIVASRKLRIEIAKSDAGSNRSRSRFHNPGLGSPIPLMMDFGNVDGDLRPRPPQQPQEAQPSWMSGDLERELSALIGPDLDFLRIQNAGLEEAKRAFITEERARHANFEERLKLESEQRLAVYADNNNRRKGLPLTVSGKTCKRPKQYMPNNFRRRS